jgi:fructokinase
MIVSCGEALIDFLPLPKASSGSGGESAFSPHAGGSPFNVAIAVGRLGSPAGFFGGLSSDLFGETLDKALRASNVDTSFANRSDRPTTLAFVSLAGGNARYAFFDEASAGRMITDSDLPAFPKTVAALHFGSFSLAEEPCGSAFEALMQREQNDRVISLDINVRPTLIRNRDGYLARIDRLIAMSDIVKLSTEDLDWLEPGAIFANVARKWLVMGAKLVVLTKADAGAEAMAIRAFAAVPGVTVAVADTVGAGDTFMAAILARLDNRRLLTKRAVARLDEDALTDLLAFATRAAAITVSRPGADPPWQHELA